MKDLLFALLAVVGGIGITVFIYWFLNLLVRELPQKIKKKVEPYIFIGPVLILIGIFIVIPTIQSIRLSFMEEEIDGSDLAPAVVNATEWTELTNWIAGKKTQKQAFDAIDASWKKA